MVYWILLIYDIKPELSLHNDDKDDKKGTTEGKRRLYLEHNAVEFIGLKNPKIIFCCAVLFSNINISIQKHMN